MIHCASKKHSVEQNPLHDTTNNIDTTLPRITEKIKNTEANNLLTRLYSEIYIDLDIILDKNQTHNGTDLIGKIVGLLNQADTIFKQLAENVTNEDKETNEIIQSYIKKANDFLFDKYENSVDRQISQEDLYDTIKSINIEYKTNVEVSVTPKEFYMICSLYFVELKNAISQKITKDMMQRQKEHAYEMKAQDCKKLPKTPESYILNIERSNSNTISITNTQLPNFNFSPDLKINIGADAVGSYTKLIGQQIRDSNNKIEECSRCWNEKYANKEACDSKTKDNKVSNTDNKKKEKAKKDDKKPNTTTGIQDDEKPSTSSSIKDDAKEKAYGQHTPKLYLDEAQDTPLTNDRSESESIIAVTNDNEEQF
ncbi:hypothetical protein BDAP_000067 [Binucleata daphniae]